MFDGTKALHLVFDDGSWIDYQPDHFTPAECKERRVEFEHKVPFVAEAKFFGHASKRNVKWFGSFDYTYSRTVKKADPMPQWCVALAERAEKYAEEALRRCSSPGTVIVRPSYVTGGDLMNEYVGPNQGVMAHSDSEDGLAPGAPIVGMTITTPGAERYITFRHKAFRYGNIKLRLRNGSIYAMGGTCQKHWTHAIEVDKSVPATAIRWSHTWRQYKTSLSLRDVATAP